MKKLFLVVFVLFAACVTAPESRFQPQDVPWYMPVTDSAADRSDFYVAQTKAIDTPEECAKRIQELLKKSDGRSITVVTTDGFDFYGENKLGETKQDRCSWKDVIRNRTDMLKTRNPKTSNYLYAVYPSCNSEIIPVAAFESRADAELFHALLYRMIDLHH